ncbi:hypothetical protein MLD38_019573 [Melastoma candidum]|uniref:Uncharacterized protein n=1 Tax=Melastoma candidum TaxID=119954 RepID=A0ACB9QXF7_9MYRT|nr:hypothetical protein MLD38_019573 [Melastoma candidum]
MAVQAFLFLAFSAILLLGGTHATTFTFTNNCPYTIWPGTLTGSGSSQLSSTGFELAPRANSSVSANAPWSGRFWARTGCSTDASGKFSCATADCASGVVACNGAGAIPPASLAEFTLATGGGLDFFDVSLVDGYNLPLSIIPQGGKSGCRSSSCPGNINKVCPPDFAVKDQSGKVIACQSACEALGSPQYCCTGAYGSPQTCHPTSYSQIFKMQCPQAYSYAYDDRTSTFTCGGSPNYLITFCP